MRKLRLGVLVDSNNIPAWAWEMFRVIEAEGFAETAVIIRNSNPKPSGKPSSFLYRVYRWIDRKLFRVKQDAFVRKNIFKVPGLKATELVITPQQKKFSDWLQAVDLARIKSFEPDILIRLGFRILKGEVLTVAPLGIWSFHHGDNRVNRGGPPCFWEVMLGWHVTGSVLQVLSEKLDAGTVLYRSWSRTDPLSVNRNANKVYWKSLFFIPRQLKRLATLGEENWETEIDSNQDASTEYNNPIYTPPGNLRMILLLLPFVGRNLIRKIRETFKREFWQIYVGEWRNELPPSTKQLTPVPSPANRYYADPFVFNQNEQCVVFLKL